MFTFVVCSVFKNESHILEEWINHYLLHGVEYIYLVNDFSTDNFLPIIEKYKEYITLYHNDIITENVGRQCLIYEKYFIPIKNNSKWISILDMDEFLYSPNEINLKNILLKYDNYSQLVVNWLHFTGNDHILQPLSVVESFTKRAIYNPMNTYITSHKTIIKSSNLIKFNIHDNIFNGSSYNFTINENSIPELVINHYNLQSKDFYINIKGTRGDCDNWFNHVNLKRNEDFYNLLDLNEKVDLELYKQNKEIIYNIKQNKIDSSDDVTVLLTSCNRTKLLDSTLESFIKYNTYPIKEFIILDDSGIINCNEDVLKKYKSYLKIHSLYNKQNMGQMKSIDKLYSYVKTKYIFHCEEDWEFLERGFIEKSMKIFKENPNEKIYTIWLRPHHETSGHPIIYDNLNRGYYLMKKDYSYFDNGIKYTWGGITFNPGLRKTLDCLKFHPYLFNCEYINNGKMFVGEYTINKKYTEDGYYSYILDLPTGHVKHIGWGHHIERLNE